MNAVVMSLWLDRVFDELTVMPQHSSSLSRVLYMDNMSAHTAPELKQQGDDAEIDVRMLPPNCTQLLQPLDHSINGLFKRALHKQWLMWFRKLVASGEAGRTKHGNWKIATREQFNQWVAAAWASITSTAIVNAFDHALTGKETLKAAQERLKGKEPVVIRSANTPVAVSDPNSNEVSVQEMEEFDEMIQSSFTLDHGNDNDGDEYDSDRDSDYCSEEDDEDDEWIMSDEEAKHAPTFVDED